MKVVILAGGLGTRISEESQLKPKPMIEIGDKPILWHIMKIYAHYGFDDFIICLGYKGYCIKEYFANYYLYESDVIHLNFKNQRKGLIYDYSAEPWKVTLAETGKETLTGGRVKLIQKYVGDEPFMLTYGDGVSDVDINELVKYHRSHGKIATVTATQPNGKFGALQLSDNNMVEAFREKPQGDGGWVNAGFFVLQPEVFNYLDGPATIFEREPLESLARTGQLMAYKHRSFWHPMDTLKDKNDLEELWKTGKAPWKKW